MIAFGTQTIPAALGRKELVGIANRGGREAWRNLRPFCLRAVPPALAAILFLLPHAAQADVANTGIPGTGLYFCDTSRQFDPYSPNCVDGEYNALAGPGLNGAGPLVGQAGTFALQGPPAGITFRPPTGGWDFPGGDSGCCAGVFDWYTQFGVSGLPSYCSAYAAALGNPNCEITLSMSVAAEGYVGVSVGPSAGNGYGGYGGNSPGSPILFNTANDTPFYMTFYATNGTNFLDFVFTGCDNYNPLSPYLTCNPAANPWEPIVALYVDPSWSIAPPGTPAFDTPEFSLIATGGVPPTATPEPRSVPLLGSALLAMVVMLLRHRKHKPCEPHPAPCVRRRSALNVT